MERKEFVKALGEYFGVKPKYLGVPSCNYAIETEEGILIIDRDSKVTMEDSEQEVRFIITKEGKVEREQSQSIEPEQIEETEPINLEVAVPMDKHTGATLRNIINMIASKQPLIKKALDLETNIVDSDFITGINEAKIETLEDFKTAIEDIGEKSCPGIRFDFFEKKIIFRFYQDEEKREAYIQLISLINQKANEQKYASAKWKETDNEKYAFRTWLLRLGMIGREYKVVRKQLMENLSGNSAFRNGKPQQGEGE